MPFHSILPCVLFIPDSVSDEVPLITIDEVWNMVPLIGDIIDTTGAVVSTVLSALTSVRLSRAQNRMNDNIRTRIFLFCIVDNINTALRQINKILTLNFDSKIQILTGLNPVRLMLDNSTKPVLLTCV